MKKPNKYNYLRVIQQNYGQGWEDASTYETDSNYITKEMTNNGKSLLFHDYKEYVRLGYPTRVISRKELNTLPV